MDATRQQWEGQVRHMQADLVVGIEADLQEVDLAVLVDFAPHAVVAGAVAYIVVCVAPLASSSLRLPFVAVPPSLLPAVSVSLPSLFHVPVLVVDTFVCSV